MDSTNNDHVNGQRRLAPFLIPERYTKFLDLQLGGRQAFVEFRRQKSSYRRIKVGVLLPVLFNIYLTSLLEPSLDIPFVSYSDDCTVFASGVDIDDICTK